MSTFPDMAAVESRLAGRYGHPALACPSGRLALFLALTAYTQPGDRVLMSPLTDDVVAFVVLAAGLRPVFAPVEVQTGNLAVDAVADAVWASVDAALTTNLYGVAEDSAGLRARCDDHGVVLIEDIAHALPIDDADGRPLGHRGDAMVISLSKHGLGQGGGALVARDATVLAEAADRLPRQLRSPRLRDRSRTMLGRLVRGTPFQNTAGSVRQALGRQRRVGHRMAVRPLELSVALAGSPDLATFDPWVGIDRRRYRETPDANDATDAVRSLDRAEVQTEARINGTARLAELDAASPGARHSAGTPLFRVPLLVADRARAARALEDAGHLLHYIYDPPLDDVLGAEFADPSPDPEVARWWAAHALPVDPLAADEAVQAAASDPAAFAAAPPL